MADVVAKNQGEVEFHQAVQEVAESLEPVLARNPKYREHKILERIVEPERIIMFRVPWVDDKGEIQINRGYRVEMNSAIGPYKGGLRFHPTVYLGMLKFLAFEQVFKNSLTTLPMGGGKGGSNFDPKGKSDGEVMRFCQSFMTELCRHIGQFTDVPRRRHRRRRPRDRLPVRPVQAPPQRVRRRAHRQGHQLGRLAHPSRGHRLRLRLLRRGDAHHARRHARRQDLPRLGLGQRRPVHRREDPRPRRQGRHAVRLVGRHLRRGGIDREKLAFVLELKNVKRGRIDEYAAKFKGAKFIRPSTRRPDHNPLWDIKADCAFPSATQNEINAKDAANLLKNGVYVVSEGANMPTVPDGRRALHRGRYPLRPRQGRQRRRRGHLGPRDVAEQPAPQLDPRRSRHPPARHHEGHPQAVRRRRRRVRDARQLRERRQHRRLRQGRRRMLDQGLV